ncbi:hypothetical protein [Paenibacillus silviterrae]|uniref:hypothetical protein n=1 Tax=Paenibacillus silviterrae TaxID=3242194 RepID=UPI00254336E9|nr:hypothetical protein [Paenibacillus chinjuensis]
MNMKPVEMQFALHKNDEVGLKQHQLQHKPIQDQAVLLEASERKTENDRQISSKTEETAHAFIRDESKQSGGHPKERKRKRQEPGSNGQPSQARAKDHPFKGHHIDLSL